MLRLRSSSPASTLGSARPLLVLALAALTAGPLAACPSSTPKGGTGPGHGAGSGSGSAAPGGGDRPGGGGDARPPHTAGTPLLPAGGVACARQGCVYHAGARAYYTCLSGDAGACFHYGAPCTPDDACMFDPADGRYKTCSQPVEGACASWGAACTPAASCMFDPADGLHHTCASPSNGSCGSYGALCDPG